MLLLVFCGAAVCAHAVDYKTSANAALTKNITNAVRQAAAKAEIETAAAEKASLKEYNERVRDILRVVVRSYEETEFATGINKIWADFNAIADGEAEEEVFTQKVKSISQNIQTIRKIHRDLGDSIANILGLGQYRYKNDTSNPWNYLFNRYSSTMTWSEAVLYATK